MGLGLRGREGGMMVVTANFKSNNQNKKAYDWACCQPSRTKFMRCQMKKNNISSVLALHHCAMYQVHTEQTQGKNYDLGCDAYKGMPYGF
jgi:hypothetical protein